MINFTFEGRDYRTNDDATIIEGRDCNKWNRTFSLKIILAAREAVKNATAVFTGIDADGFASYNLKFDI